MAALNQNIIKSEKINTKQEIKTDNKKDGSENNSIFQDQLEEKKPLSKNTEIDKSEDH
jgi:hypothetical protein